MLATGTRTANLCAREFTKRFFSQITYVHFFIRNYLFMYAHAEHWCIDIRSVHVVYLLMRT